MAKVEAPPDPCPCREYPADFVSTSRHGTYLGWPHPKRLKRYRVGRILSNRITKVARMIEFVCYGCGRIGWRNLGEISDKKWMALRGIKDPLKETTHGNTG